MQPIAQAHKWQFSVLSSFPFNSLRPQLFRGILFNNQHPNHHRVVQSTLKAQENKCLTQLRVWGAAHKEHLSWGLRISEVFPAQ